MGPSWIVEARVDAAVVERLTALTTDARPAFFVDDADLDWFNGVLMELVVPSAELDDPDG